MILGVFASQVGSGALDLSWSASFEGPTLGPTGAPAGASCEGGVAEAVLKRAARRESDGREAHRGSVTSSEHSWAVQAPPAAPAAVVWETCVLVQVCPDTKCVHV